MILYTLGGAFALSCLWFLASYFFIPHQVPENVNISNVADRSFTVSWVTRQKPTKGFVYISENDSFFPILGRIFNRKFRDERDLLVDRWYKRGGSSDPYYVHIVHVEDLTPDTTYYFRIGSGFRLYATDSKDNDLLGVTTFSTLENQVTPDPSYGRILREDKTDVVDGALVFMQLKNSKGEKSTLLSGLTKENGTWVIDKANARTADSLKHFGTLDEKDQIIMWVDTEWRGIAEEWKIRPGEDQPTEDIVLKDDWLAANNLPTETVKYGYIGRIDPKSTPGKVYALGNMLAEYDSKQGFPSLRIGSIVLILTLLAAVIENPFKNLKIGITLLNPINVAGQRMLRYAAIVLMLVVILTQSTGIVQAQTVGDENADYSTTDLLTPVEEENEEGIYNPPGEELPEEMDATTTPREEVVGGAEAIVGAEDEQPVVPTDIEEQLETEPTDYPDNPELKTAISTDELGESFVPEDQLIAQTGEEVLSQTLSKLRHEGLDEAMSYLESNWKESYILDKNGNVTNDRLQVLYEEVNKNLQEFKNAPSISAGVALDKIRKDLEFRAASTVVREHGSIMEERYIPDEKRELVTAVYNELFEQSLRGNDYIMSMSLRDFYQANRDIFEQNEFALVKLNPGFLEAIASVYHDYFNTNLTQEEAWHRLQDELQPYLEGSSEPLPLHLKQILAIKTGQISPMQSQLEQEMYNYVASNGGVCDKDQTKEIGRGIFKVSMECGEQGVWEIPPNEILPTTEILCNGNKREAYAVKGDKKVKMADVLCEQGCVMGTCNYSDEEICTKDVVRRDSEECVTVCSAGSPESVCASEINLNQEMTDFDKTTFLAAYGRLPAHLRIEHNVVNEVTKFYNWAHYAPWDEADFVTGRGGWYGYGALGYSDYSSPELEGETNIIIHEISHSLTDNLFGEGERHDRWSKIMTDFATTFWIKREEEKALSSSIQVPAESIGETTLKSKVQVEPTFITSVADGDILVPRSGIHLLPGNGQPVNIWEHYAIAMALYYTRPDSIKSCCPELLAFLQELESCPNKYWSKEQCENISLREKEEKNTPEQQPLPGVPTPVLGVVDIATLQQIVPGKDSIQEVKEIAGEPSNVILGEKEDQTFFLYDTDFWMFNHIVAMKDDIVDYVIISKATTNTESDQYISQYGEPEKTTPDISGGNNYRLIWSEKGIAIIVNNYVGKVMSEIRTQPMSIAEYREKFGASFRSMTPFIESMILSISNVMEYDLKEGWNLVSLPYVISDNYFASSLLRDIAQADGYATTVSTYQNGKWLTYKQRGDVSFSDEDFPIVPGRGYFIRVHQPATLKLTGSLPAEPVSTNLDYGWNLVGIHPGYNEEGTEKIWNHSEGEDGWMAVEVIDSARSEGIETNTVTEYKSGKYVSVIKDEDNAGQLLVYGSDYAIDEKRGYFIRVESSGKKWVP